MSVAHLFGPPTIDDVRSRAASAVVPRAALQDATARVLAESGGLLLCGPDGSGRTHALRMVASALAERGRTAIWLPSGGTPYAAVGEALGRPGLTDIDEAARSLADLLDVGDAVLLVDDWPDLDAPSQKVVERLREITQPTVIATGPVARAGWRVVPIAPFSSREVELLLATLLGPVPSDASVPLNCDQRLVETTLALAGPWPGPVVRFANALVEADALILRDGQPAARERQLATLARSFPVDPPWPLPSLPPPVVRLATVVAWAQPIDRQLAMELARAQSEDVRELVRLGWMGPRPGKLRFSGPVARRIQRQADADACASLVRYWGTQQPIPWVPLASVLAKTEDPGLLAELGSAALQALLPVEPNEAMQLALLCPPPPAGDAKGIECFLDCHSLHAQAVHQRQGPEGALEVVSRVPAALGRGTVARVRFDRVRGQLYWALGRTQDAAIAYEAAAGQTNDGEPLTTLERARLLHHAGTAYAEVGDLGGAIRCFELAKDLFRDQGRPRSVMAVARGLCSAFGALGEREQAETAGAESLALAQSLSFDRVAALVLLSLADAALADGDLPAARRHLEDAADASQGDPRRRPDLERRLAQIAVLQRDADAERLARRAIDVAGEHDARIECGLAWAVLAWAAAQSSRDGVRQTATRNALQALREVGATAELALARLFVAEACLEGSEPHHEEAADHAEAVLHFANEFARPPLRAWAQRVLVRARGRQKASPLQQLTQLATRISLQDNLDDLLRDLATAAVELADADRAMVVLCDDNGDPEPVATAGAHAYAAPSMSIVRRVIETGREVVATDLGERGDLRNSASVVAMNLQAAIGFPLHVDGEVIGALYLDSQDTPTGELETALALLRALAAHASVALHQTKLTEAIRRRANAAERAWRYADDLLRAVPTPVVIADASGTTLDANDTAQTWFEEGDPTPVTERLEPLAGGFADEHLLRTDDGRRVPVHLTRRQAEAPDGRTLTLFGLTDLSTRIAAEAQMARAAEIARESTAAKSRFLLSMSHELRTPLNAITGYAEMLMEDGMEGDAADDLGRVVQSAQRLLGLIDNVLDISRIEAGRLDVVLGTENLSDTVTQAVQRLRPGAMEQGIALHCEIEGIADWHTDHERVEQIIENLLQNAIEHAEASRIDVRAVGTPDEVTIEVGDDGTGIPSQRMETLFQPFQRLDPAERPGGAGLGLAISYRLAQRLGGVLSVETGIGQGTHFKLFLPRES